MRADDLAGLGDEELAVVVEQAVERRADLAGLGPLSVYVGTRDILSPDVRLLEQRARAAGATGWIVKPFDPVKLVDAVRRVAA